MKIKTNALWGWIIVLIVAGILPVSTGAFEPQVHEDLVRAALGLQMSSHALEIVASANLAEDSVVRASAEKIGGHQRDAWRHFDNVRNASDVCALWEKAIKSRFDEAVEASAPKGAEKRQLAGADAALAAFGRLTHALQDFYSHTNWLEGMLESGAAPGEIIRGDADRGSNPLLGEVCDPRSFPESLSGGYFNISYLRPGAQGQAVSGCPPLGPPPEYSFCHEQINKDSTHAGHGAARPPGESSPTYHEMAWWLAMRATREAWDELHRRIVARYGKDETTDAECLFTKLAWQGDRTCHRYWRFSGTIQTRRQRNDVPGFFEEASVTGFEVRLHWIPTRYEGPKASPLFAKVEGHWSVGGDVRAHTFVAPCNFEDTARLNVAGVEPVVGRLKVAPEPAPVEFTGIGEIDDGDLFGTKIPCRINGSIPMHLGHPTSTTTGLNVPHLLCLTRLEFCTF